ncbi:MAG: type II toxin-antitoxin system RelE/ParE family toxin [Anaerolineales bacterium]
MIEIIETPVFTKQVLELLDDESYRALQVELIARPHARPIIPGSGGLRKLRWAGGGHGKQGGVRVIYYWLTANDQIFMLYMYPKNERSDLTPAQLRVLRQLIEEK